MVHPKDPTRASRQRRLARNNIYYFVGIDSARFKRPVEPGDQLILEASIDRVRAGIWKFKGIARVGDEVACEAELMCTMRYVGPEKQA